MIDRALRLERVHAEVDAAQRRRAAWLQRRWEDGAAERGVPFTVRAYPPDKTPAVVLSGTARPDVRPSDSPPPVRVRRRLFTQADERDGFEFFRSPRGCRAFVPEHLLITGGVRAWRCEVSP